MILGFQVPALSLLVRLFMPIWVFSRSRPGADWAFQSLPVPEFGNLVCAANMVPARRREVAKMQHSQWRINLDRTHGWHHRRLLDWISTPFLFSNRKKYSLYNKLQLFNINTATVRIAVLYLIFRLSLNVASWVSSQILLYLGNYSLLNLHLV